MNADIEKGNCAMCIAEYRGNKSKAPIYHFRVGVHRVHLCKEHFYEFMDTMIEFYEKDKDEVNDAEQK